MPDTKISAETLAPSSVGAFYLGYNGGTNYRYADDITGDLRMRLNGMADMAKALSAYRRFLDLVAFGFKASGDADATSTGGSVDTSAGAWKPTPAGGVISGGTGTNIGNMTGNAGLAGIFNGTTNSDNVGSGYNSGTSGYAGKTYSGGKKIEKVNCHGTNSNGYNSAGAVSVTLTLYGKTGSAPANATDGTSLGSITFTASATDESAARTITSSNQTTLYDHVWVTITSTSGNLFFAELVFYEAAFATNSVLITPYQTADAARTKVRGIFEIDPVDSITLGTDWTVEYSCNGGTNWAAASTYTNCGKGQSGRTVVETEEVTCTSGTSFAARVKNLNNKSVHVYKSAMKAAA